MRGVIPNGLRRLIFPRNPVLLATCGEGGVRLTIVERQGESPLGAASAIDRRLWRKLARALSRRQLDLVLGLPSHSVLRQDVQLPSAATEDLGAVIAYQLERLTPFKPDEVHYTWEPIAEASQMAAQNKVAVRLTLANKGDVAGQLAVLAETGLSPLARLDVTDNLGRPEGLDLLRTEPKADKRGSALTVSLAIGVVLLTLALLTVDWHVRSNAVAALQDRRSALQAALSEQLEATSTTADADVAAYNFVANQRSVAEAVAAVTTVLPDGSWLESLSFDAGRLELAGRSTDAAALPRLFAADPRFARPQFVAPVVMAEDGERFVLTLEFLGARADGDGR